MNDPLPVPLIVTPSNGSHTVLISFKGCWYHYSDLYNFSPTMILSLRYLTKKPISKGPKTFFLEILYTCILIGGNWLCWICLYMGSLN